MDNSVHTITQEALSIGALSLSVRTLIFTPNCLEPHQRAYVTTCAIRLKHTWIIAALPSAQVRPMTHMTTLAPDRILQLGTAFWGSKALLSAVELGLFTELAKDGPLSAEALRARLNLHERSARDFLDTLVALGMLERGEDGRYANAPEADLYLDRAKPSYVGGLLEMANARLYPFWGRLTEAFRTGAPQNEAADGRSDPFSAIYAEPKTLEGFLNGMTGVSLPTARAIATVFPWQEYTTGFGSGSHPPPASPAQPGRPPGAVWKRSPRACVSSSTSRVLLQFKSHTSGWTTPLREDHRLAIAS